MNIKQPSIILLTLMLALSGCVEYALDIEGRYYSEVNPGAYLELRDDGQFVVNQDMSFAGQYTVTGNTVKLIYSFGSFELVRDGNILIDGDGERWIRV